ncbi:hypothetical protein COV11_00795 [Candidatus Woesearchaeota archaeon CG10_big_fil_rev_8_21_14_0_10_30_7]|nr:MAG: hypothetical protein COV11_00795 [Candidatus Woesearchaeota archaeon CG10_big_fil_rev_8_21_14_0_10_30_7]
MKEQNKIELEDKFVEALKYHEEIKGRQENSVIELREDYQYGTKKEISNQTMLQKIINLCLEIIEITKKEIYKKSDN